MGLGFERRPHQPQESVLLITTFSPRAVHQLASWFYDPGANYATELTLISSSAAWAEGQKPPPNERILIIKLRITWRQAGTWQAVNQC